jgi:hypothetical protein
VTQALKNLATQTRQFATTLQSLLNQTVCDNARILGRTGPDRLTSVVGTSLDNLSAYPVRLRSRSDVPAWIEMISYLSLDKKEGTFLTVQSSVVGLSFGHEKDMLAHYDYEREKETYPEAHIQVHARHDAFERFVSGLGRKPRGALGKVHLPVGGRRFRPSLEDVVELLIVEGFVDPKPGWESALVESRQPFREIQLAAAVRGDHNTAVQELERSGYQIVPPLFRPPTQRKSVAGRGSR